ncbi:hypothetical protein D3C74_43710 [compost metagenome]
MQIRVCPECDGMNQPTSSYCEFCHASIKDVDIQERATVEINRPNKQEIKCAQCGAVNAKRDFLCCRCKEPLRAEGQDVRSSHSAPRPKSVALVLAVAIGVIGVLITIFTLGQGADDPQEAVAQFTIHLSNEDYSQVRGYLSSEAKNLYSDYDLRNMHSYYFGDGKRTMQAGNPVRFYNSEKEAVTSITTLGDNDPITNSRVTLVKGLFGWKISNIEVP